MKGRKYKSGSRWALWRWTEVPSGFITRLHLLKTPWFAVCLHWLHKPDPEPWLHDHPIGFLSIILRGSYFEFRRRSGEAFGRLVHRRWFNWVSASLKDRHSIEAVAPRTLTLCFMGPKVREWGYHTDKGWVHWKEYNEAAYRAP